MAGRRRHARWLIPVAAVLLLPAVFFVVMLLPVRDRPAATALAAEPGPTGSLNIVVIGRDARALGPVRNEGHQRNPREESSRSDVVVLAHINFELGRVALYGIPRDLLVPVPGVTGETGPTDFENMEKLAHVHAIGGPPLLRRTLEHLLGVRIHRHLAFDFDTYRITLGLLRPFLAGARLDGVALADHQRMLQLARRRQGLAEDDIDRSRNNVRIIAAVLARTWWLADTRAGRSVVRRLLTILGDDTDLTYDEIRQVIWGLKHASWHPRELRAAVLVGEGMDINLNRYSAVLSCYLPAYREVRRQVKRFLEDEDDTEAVDFMTRQPYAAPAYLFEPRPAPPPAGTPAPDSAEARTLLMEMRQAGLAPDSGN